MGLTNAFARTVSCALAALPPKKRMRAAARVVAVLEDRFPASRTWSVDTPCGVIRIVRDQDSLRAANRLLKTSWHEPETFAWIRDHIKDGDVLWDIGASIGLYSLAAALHADVRVYGFEPDHLLHHVFCKHVALNGRQASVIPCNAALSDITAPGIFWSLPDDEFGHRLAVLPLDRTPGPGAKPVSAVLSYRVDDFRRIFSLPPPDHIKLDVDGLEIAILEGAKDTLPHVRSLIVEVEGDVKRRLEKDGYALLRRAGFTEAPIEGPQSGRNRLFLKPPGGA